MPSLREELMRTVGAPALMAACGDPAGVTLTPPTAGAAAFSWPCIVGRLETGPVDDLAGTHERRERRESTTLAGEPLATPIVMGTTADVPAHPGAPFEVERIDRSGALVVLTVYRIAEVETIQRRGFERSP